MLDWKSWTRDLHTPDHPLRGGGGYIEDACGEYRRPLSFLLGLLWKSSEKGRNWKRKSLKNVPRKL